MDIPARLLCFATQLALASALPAASASGASPLVQTKPVVTMAEESSGALYEKGLDYLEGRGVLKDTPAAKRWLDRAAEKGHHEAQLKLARLCLAAKPETPEDTRLAVKWFREAAKWGSAEAQYEMGKFCAAGWGTTWDDKLATSYYLLAAAQGLAKAQHDVAVRYDLGKGVDIDKAAAAHWYFAAADQDDPDAQYNYACMLDSGEGVMRNPGEAVRWFRSAAMMGMPRAQYNLGTHYAAGIGAPKDEVLALAWFNVAAASGIVEAAKARDLAELALGHEGVLKAQEMSRAFFRDITLATTVACGAPSSLALTPEALEDPKITASGSIISAGGLVLTAAHAIRGGTRFVAVLPHGTCAATIERVDEANDLALLRLEAGHYTPLLLAPQAPARLGQPIATIGFPNVNVQGQGAKVTRGEISGLDGSRDEPRDWQISAPVQAGNSGGPLLDERGRLLGVIVSKLNGPIGDDLPQNVNYARKGAYVRALLEPYLDELPTATPLVTPAPNFADMIETARKSVVALRTY